MDESRVCKSNQYSLIFKLAAAVYELINYFLLKFRLAIQCYYYADKSILELINQERFSRNLMLTIPESLQIYEAAKSAVKIKGDYAEVGVYRGGSAKLIAEAKGQKTLHLFDTFTGLPETNSKDRYFRQGEYAASLKSVKEKLSKYSNLYYYPGIFPASSEQLKKKQFALVHLDVDLYQSTKDSLEFFYPKMSKGGLIISHDFPSSVGVRKAFDEFMKDKAEMVIKMSGNQGLIVKV